MSPYVTLRAEMDTLESAGEKEPIHHTEAPPAMVGEMAGHCAGMRRAGRPEISDGRMLKGKPNTGAERKEAKQFLWHDFH